MKAIWLRRTLINFRDYKSRLKLPQRCFFVVVVVFASWKTLSPAIVEIGRQPLHITCTKPVLA